MWSESAASDQVREARLRQAAVARRRAGSVMGKVLSRTDGSAYPTPRSCACTNAYRRPPVPVVDFAMDSNRPNILFAIADDASHMAAYGHGFVSTPAFDRVAADGVRFDAAFTSNPKCAPSRASLLTGRHTWQLEEACNHFGIFPDKFPVYPDILEAAGYTVGFTGKGWAPGDWEAGGRTRNPAGPAWNGKTLTPPNNCISNKDYAANFEAFLNAAGYSAGAATAAGGGASRAAADITPTPFCFWYGGHEPHRPYDPGEGERSGINSSTVPVPAYLPDEERVRVDLADYAAEVAWFDRHLGAMLETLEERGLLEDTLIVVTSDNGMPFPRVKGQMYEADFRLPMAAMWRGHVPGGRVIEDLVSFVDVAPTFLEAAGLAPSPTMSGRSLLSLLTSDRAGLVDGTRNRVYMGREKHDLGRENDLGYPVRCLRTLRFLYVRNFAPERWPAGNPETGFTNIDSSPTKSLILEQHAAGNNNYYDLAMGKRPAEELYDIAKDPDCLHNLAGDPDFGAIRRELGAELLAVLRAEGDPRALGNGDVFESYEYTGNDHHSWKAYVEGRWEAQWY